MEERCVSSHLRPGWVRVVEGVALSLFPVAVGRQGYALPPRVAYFAIYHPSEDRFLTLPGLVAKVILQTR
jgi:hypothetical protein